MLDPSVRHRLQDRYQQLNAEGKLLSRAQLDQFYAAFRGRFGPDVLAGLDGEALLDLMHAQKDSLVYWLEFKNDDEFPARFGSIAGGSALKFGIFKRKETGAWTTAGEGKSLKEITKDEAISAARRHRDQLIRGVELLGQLPPTGTDADYARLQEQMDREAPDVSDLAWGHKYFSLICPEKVDLYHSPDWQRFRLVQLLQLPPEGRGRYVCAGRFVAAAAELDLPMHHFYEVLNASYGPKYRYWRIGTSNGTAPRNRWALMRDSHCVAIGWSAVGDLSWIEVSSEYSSTGPTKDTRETLKQKLAEFYPNAPQAIGKACTQIINFVKVLANGDLVLACDGATVLGIGRVTGDYSFDAASDFPHRRGVQWLSFDEWKMPEPEGLLTTVHPIKQHLENLLEVEKRVQATSDITSAGEKAGTQIVTSGHHGAVPMLQGIPGRIQSVLERKGQVIVYGPPGTGKTFWAERAALDLAAYRAFGRPYGDLDESARTAVLGDGAGLVRICCFHPAYGYEDFIEGYRPVITGGHVAFSLRDGVFKRTCRDAEKNPGRNFYLIVDEINRGDIPRIFGELLTVLEMDKRKKPIVLPVSGESFRVPENVFLIGTMNTADRSISLLDAALRRRFGFVELMPDASVLHNHVVSGIPLGPWLDALNHRIRTNVGRDARNLQVGHSYLLPAKNLGLLKRILRDDVFPLLEEYCYEDYTSLQKILGHGFVDAVGQRIRHELFADEQDETLIQALKETCPEIMASSEAITSSLEPDEGIDDGTTDDERDQ